MVHRRCPEHAPQHLAYLAVAADAGRDDDRRSRSHQASALACPQRWARRKQRGAGADRASGDGQ